MSLPLAHKSRPLCNPSTGERAVAFVVARLSSSRLPGKQLRIIGDRPLLQWIIDSLRSCNELDDIVITTVAEKGNEPLRKFASTQGIKCFWYKGDVDHVTTRLRKAAEHYDADICILVSGDCPLIYPPAINLMVKESRENPAWDSVFAEKGANGEKPWMQGIRVYRKRAWKRADDLSKLPELREHQFPIIPMRPDLFRSLGIQIPKGLCPSSHRLSVDTFSDLEFMNLIYGELKTKCRDFSLPNAVQLLKEKPEIKSVNAHVHQRGIGEKMRRTLIVVDKDTGSDFNYLSKNMDLARQLVERKGWPVTFLIKDKVASKIVRENGFRTVQGALWKENHAKSSGSLEENDLLEAVSGFDLVLIDTIHRCLPENWRSKFSTNTVIPINKGLKDWKELLQQVDLE